MDKKIIMAGLIGAGCARRLLEERKKELGERFSTSFLGQARDKARFVISEEAVREAAERGAPCVLTGAGGIFAALWHLAEEEGAGLVSGFDRLPIPQELIEIFNFLDEDPYTSRDEGSILTAAANADEVIKRLHKAGIPAVVIGRLNDTKARVIMRGDTCCYLNKPERGEQ